VPATVADHVTPHRGDWAAFCTGKLQSLCDPCHKSTKVQIEQRGYCCDVGLDGLPIDPNHPFNRAGRLTRRVRPRLCASYGIAHEGFLRHEHL
jgi:hypothetical protein